MTDREKVIKGLECHISRKCETDAVKHEICPYWEHDECVRRVMHDALEQLNEQENQLTMKYEEGFHDGYRQAMSEAGMQRVFLR